MASAPGRPSNGRDTVARCPETGSYVVSVVRGAPAPSHLATSSRVSRPRMSYVPRPDTPSLLFHDTFIPDPTRVRRYARVWIAPSGLSTSRSVPSLSYSHSVFVPFGSVR